MKRIRLAKTISEAQRSRVEAQGFVSLDDDTIADIYLWLRLTPAISLVWAAAGTYLASAMIVWSLVPFAALGIALRNHPFDTLYNAGIRHGLGTPRLPPYNKPRRLGCGMAAAWLAATSIAFHTGAHTAGQILGVMFGLVSLINVTTGVFVSSYVFAKLFGPPRVTAELVAYAAARRVKLASRPKWRRKTERTLPRVFTSETRAWFRPRGSQETVRGPRFDGGATRPT